MKNILCLIGLHKLVKVEDTENQVGYYVSNNKQCVRCGTKFISFKLVELKRKK